MGECLTIGVLAPLLGGHYFGGILTGVARLASAAGVRAIALQTFDAGKAKIDYLSLANFRHRTAWQQVSGFVVILNAADSRYLDELRAAGKPVVKVSQGSPGFSGPLVVPDNGAGTRTAVEHLIQHGHRRIAFAGWSGQEDLRERYQAYRDTLIQHGLEPDPRLRFDTGDNLQTGGARVAREMVAAGLPSTAVFCASDFNAIGLMHELIEAGYRLPADQAVVGFDGVTAGAYATPTLTTAEARFDNVGELAADLVLRLLRGESVAPGRHYAPSSFIVRESCGCPVGKDSSGELGARSRALYLENTKLEKTMTTQYEVSMDLLRRHEDDPRALSWLGLTAASAGCLGLWSQGRRPQGRDPFLDVVGTFDSDPERRRAPGGRYPVSAFPPAERMRLDALGPGEIVCVVPVKMGSTDWGVLSFVAPIDTQQSSMTETMNQWAALLSVALGREWVVESLRAHEEQLRRAALYDALTGLPNRALFLERTVEALRRSEERPGHRFAVLFLDLDGFKLVNDSLGHLAGDQLLTQVAERISAELRAEDTAARFGGDEFAILIDGIADTPTLVAIAERIQAVIAEPVTAVGQEVVVTASIGIAPWARRYHAAEDLLRDADIAMYRAKSTDKGTHTIFSASMHAEAVSRLRTEAQLRRAIERRRLELHYQPIVELATATTVGLEALLRWRHPTRGLLLPGQFLAIAEDAGLLLAIGSLVTSEVCRQLARWRRAHAIPEDLWVSLNVSHRHFWSGVVAEEVVNCLAANGIPPQCLALEITESVITHSVTGARTVLEQLHGHGVKLNVDDFGTGYSSLGVLRQLPIDALKIDRSFMTDLTTDTKTRELVHTIILLGESLGIDVIAEGVETEDQRDQLRQLGCRYGQGHLFARPLPSALAVPPAS